MIISTVRPYLKGIAKVEDDKHNLVSTGAFCVLRSDKLDSDYLFGFVRSNYFIDMICRSMSGTTYPTVSDDDILDLHIPFPSLEIQNKIGQEVRRRREKAELLKRQARQCLEEAKKEAEEIILNKK